MREVIHNKRHLNWIKSVFVLVEGEIREIKIPYTCDQCSEDAKYGDGTNLFCPDHWLEKVNK